MRAPVLLQPNRLFRAVYPDALWHMDRTKNAIYLTFDDGPVPGVTEWVLEELKKYGASATFFCVGENVIRYPAIFNALKAAGHTVANHTLRHKKGTALSRHAYLDDVESCEKLTQSRLFRPPYGRMTRPQYRALLSRGYKIVMWDVISYDYERITPERCARTVLRKTRPGSIVLFHDSARAEEKMRFALSSCLEAFTQQGYVFRALEA